MFTVTPHRVNGGHAEQATARGVCGQFHRSERVTVNALDAVVVGEESVDDDVTRFEEFADAEVVPQEVGEGGVDF